MIHAPLSFAFFGTDDFSVDILEKLRESGFLPKLVITVPDRPKGRGLHLSPPPIKLWALSHHIPVLQPIKLDVSFCETLRAARYTCFIVASYGLILTKEVLGLTSKGTLNVHPSLLPKYRGATPLESQILSAEKERGVTIILMDEKMDHGPIVAQKQIDSGSYGKASELRKKMAEEGGLLLAETLPRWINEEITPIPQDDTKATYTKKLKKSDGELNLADNPLRNFLKIQAYDGGIGTYFFVKRSGKRMRVAVKNATFSNGALLLTRVVPEGRKEMGYAEFRRGLS